VPFKDPVSHVSQELRSAAELVPIRNPIVRLIPLALTAVLAAGLTLAFAFLPTSTFAEASQPSLTSLAAKRGKVKSPPCRKHPKQVRHRAKVKCTKPKVKAKLRSGTVQASPEEVRSVSGDPDGTLRITLRKGSARPKVGRPFIVPISGVAPSGVLGIVTSVVGIKGGQVAVKTRPAALDEAYAQLRIELEGATLGELESSAGASMSTAKLFTCTGSGPAAKFDIDSDFSKLKPDFLLDIGRPEIFFILSGTAQLDVDLSSKASASCKYTGNAKFTIPIYGTPVVVTIKPTINGSLSGEVGAGFAWSPRMAVGIQKGPGVDQSFHTLNKGTISTPSFHGSAQAKAFAGVSVGVSVAERVGIEGTAGPQLNAGVSASGSSICLDAKATLHADLSAYADVFVKRWSFSIAKGDFGELQLLHACRKEIRDNDGVKTPPGNTYAGPVTVFPLTPWQFPMEITSGPDGNLWATDSHQGSIARITTSGQVTQFFLPGSPRYPNQIAAGPDGNMWFTDGGAEVLGKITPTGAITEYDLSGRYGTYSTATGVSAGPDGNIWFTFGNGIAKMDPSGGPITDYYPDTRCGNSYMPITWGPDNNLWFLDCFQFWRITTGGTSTKFALKEDEWIGQLVKGPGGNFWTSSHISPQGIPPTFAMMKITPSGEITRFPMPPGRSALSVTNGSDGNIWFVDNYNNQVVRMTPTGDLTGYSMPPGTGQVGDITTGPDGNIWFLLGGFVGRLTPP
jgi:streptogramin lyase